MSTASAVQYGVFLLIVTLLVRPVRGCLARVFRGERTWLDPVLRPLERAVYRVAGVGPAAATVPLTALTDAGLIGLTIYRRPQG
jgi:K+-transporting ATPase A subunit